MFAFIVQFLNIFGINYQNFLIFLLSFFDFFSSFRFGGNFFREGFQRKLHFYSKNKQISRLNGFFRILLFWVQNERDALSSIWTRSGPTIAVEFLTYSIFPILFTPNSGVLAFFGNYFNFCNFASFDIHWNSINRSPFPPDSLSIVISSWFAFRSIRAIELIAEMKECVELNEVSFLENVFSKNGTMDGSNYFNRLKCLFISTALLSKCWCIFVCLERQFDKLNVRLICRMCSE